MSATARPVVPEPRPVERASDSPLRQRVDVIGGPNVPPAFARGFAILSQDSGHDNRTNSDSTRQGTLAFAFD